MVVDLTHTLKDNVTVYPGTPLPLFPDLCTIENDGFAEKRISITTHTGTHIDAPAHILPGSKTLDQFPLDKFIGKGTVVDCTKTSTITLSLLQSKKEQIRNADFVLFYTGWQEKWNTPHYFGPFPTLTTEAVEWLLQFPLKALGFDVLSVDSMTDETLPNHHLLLREEVLIIENLTHLDKLTGKDFQLYCIPLKIENADAAPARVFAQADG